MKHTTNSLNTEHGAKITKANFITKLSYPATEDIYNNGKQVIETDPDDSSTIKEFSETYNDAVKKDSNRKPLGGELDVPGSELDDQQEKIGSEDEENNYYSLGLDNHNELDDNRE